MIKILIADDHPLVREGLKQIISGLTDMVVVDEASNGSEVLEKTSKNNYDVAVLDISMPDNNGVDIIEQVKARKPELNILVLSIYPEEQYAVRAFKAGANGYLTKESTPEELIAAIRKVSLGRKYVSTSFAEKLASDLKMDTKQPLHKMLSNREFQVMSMIASGKTIKEIAEKMSLSAKTISTYRTRILEKMGLKNNAEIIRYGIKHGLVD
jgi:DNA-binding NarL/FixJ family response regulator